MGVLLSRRTAASGILAVVVAASVLIPSLPVRGDTTSAVQYIAGKSVTVWGAMALRAAGQSADVSSFTNVSSNKAIDYEAPILALAAHGKNPRTYPATDYVAKLQSFFDGTQLGNASELNDDIFGILALRSAGVATSDPTISASKTFILTHQDTNGGWPFAIGGDPDTNTTAAAITALIEAGVSSNDLAITKAVAYLQSAQNDDGGFPYDPVSPWGTGSDASSDAWVIIAANKLGQDAKTWVKNGNNPIDHLLTLQDTTGFFAWQAGSAEDSFSPVTTAYAVIALTGKSFPVASYAQPVYPNVSYRIAGATQDFCAGEVNAPNPLDLVKIVAQDCGFDYQITDTSFGPYLERISTDTASGVIGWLYTVNSAAPSVGAVDYQLQGNDAVLWYFADYRDLQTRLTLTLDQVNSGAPATVLVEAFETDSWQPLAGASVHAGNTLVSTGSDGKATLTLPDGIYKVFATKTGYLRSEVETLVVGTRAQNAFPLTATVPGTAGGGGSSSGAGGVSFILSSPAGATSLSFGTLQTGQTQTKQLTITNQSQQKIYVEALVTGADLFRNYLLINNAAWRNFNDKIDAATGKQIDVGLTLPTSYTNAGDKTGSLTIWATPTQ